jgi:hypothetical protein
MRRAKTITCLHCGSGLAGDTEDSICSAFTACKQACQREHNLLRQLEDLAVSERAMYELDHAQDQVMTALILVW